MQKLYITNPGSGRKVEYKMEIKRKTGYHKLVLEGKIIRGQVVVDNLATDGSVVIQMEKPTTETTTVGELLGRSNYPIYATNFEDRVVKIGLDNDGCIQWEKYGYTSLGKMAPKFYGCGHVLIGGREFPCLVMEKLDYTLESHLPTTRKQVQKVWKDMCEVVDYMKTKNLVYNDFKPTNIMWSSREKKWKLIDLESVQEQGTVATAGHTPGYAAEKCLTERYPVVTFDTDQENLMYMMHDLVTYYRKQVHDPWVNQTLTPQEIIAMRKDVDIDLPTWLTTK
jgi:serine/threonine protein kinase